MEPKSDQCPPPAPTARNLDLTIGDSVDRSLLRAATQQTAGPVSVEPIAVAAAPAVAGQPVGAADRYRTREVLGAGGMGEVRLCHDAAIGRDVAVKTLLPTRQGRAQAEQRFLREARVQGQLEHPATVPVYDLGTDASGALFFTMRRVRGHTLAEILDALARGDATMAASYSRRKLLTAFTQVCLSIDYAHTRGILHRDLKPSNIMLGDFGEVYVLDWGIATLSADRATAPPVTLPGAEQAGLPGSLVSAGQSEVVGTAGYMSPEQLLGLGELQDARTDVYALGAILFEILTLRRLHPGDTFEAVAESTRVTAEARPAKVSADVPPELDAACARAAARDRADRFGSARQLSDVIERYLDGNRDLARRRELSEERAAAAQTAIATVFAADASDEQASAARADAVREVTAALALNPDNAVARKLLVRLLTEPPSRVPPEVQSEMSAANHRNSQQLLRYGSMGIASWLLTVPAVAAVGVRAWKPILITTVLCLLALARAWWMRRLRDISFVQVLPLAFLVLATLVSASCFLGPFVQAPQIIATVTLWLALWCRTSRERLAVAAIGSFATALPFLVELFGVFPPAYAFSGGNITLFARAIALSPSSTIPLLLFASITCVALPPLFLSSFAAPLTIAERQLFLHAWQLRQVLPLRSQEP